MVKILKSWLSMHYFFLDIFLLKFSFYNFIGYLIALNLLFSAFLLIEKSFFFPSLFFFLSFYSSNKQGTWVLDDLYFTSSCSYKTVTCVRLGSSTESVDKCSCRCLAMEHGTNVCLLWSHLWKTNFPSIKYKIFLVIHTSCYSTVSVILQRCLSASVLLVYFMHYLTILELWLI